MLSLTDALTVALEEYATLELAGTAPGGAILALQINGERLEPFLRPGDPHWYWRWTAPGAAGFFTARLSAEWPDGTHHSQTHRIEVRPRKIDAERYAALLSDLQALSRRLVHALGGGAAPAAPGVQGAQPTSAELLAVCTGAAFDRFAAAVHRIAQRPPERLRPTITPVAPGQARDLSRIGARRMEPADHVADPELPPGPAQLRAIPEQQSTPTSDSYERRFLQRTLALLAQRIDQLARTPDLPAQAAADLAASQAQLRSLRALPAFAAVPPLTAYRGPTTRLQRDADYRAVLRMWQRLRRRVDLVWSEPTLELPVAELPLLYERWCALSAAEAVLNLPGAAVVAQTLLAPQPADADADWLLSLPTAAPLLTVGLPDGRQIALVYQPRYRPNPQGDRIGSLDRHTRIPDLAISVTHQQQPDSLLILDAKYRLDTTGGVPESALADAYSYLGSIGSLPSGRCVHGAAILYPGRGPAEIYPSGVAALPLLPGALAALQAWLVGLIQG